MEVAEEDMEVQEETVFSCASHEWLRD